MKFDCKQGCRGLVRDADGNVLPTPIRGDTETGLVTCYDLDNSTTELIEVERWYKPPLTITPPFPNQTHPTCIPKRG